MKVALLNCDHVNEDLLHLQGDYPAMFASLFPVLEFEVFNVCEEQFPVSVGDFDAYMVGGSRRSVYEEEGWINELKAFVRGIYENEKKYVGFCFGHQLLAESLGGKVAKSENGWCVGVHTFSVLKEKKWMLPYQNSVNLLMMCQDQVQVLPEHGEVLASSVNCPIGMFSVGKNMLGIQAHPEFSKAYDQALMELRIARMGQATVEKGIASLQKQLDQQTAAAWVLAFLSEKR